jgi:signal transduction histidine kinase
VRVRRASRRPLGALRGRPLHAPRGPRAARALGPDAVGGAQRQRQPGLWVGFTIDRDPTGCRPTRQPGVARSPGTPGSGIGIALLATLLGSARHRAADQPAAAQLSFAASRIREGDLDSRLDENTLTSEIREVNMGFNRMARELAKVEEDRAVMLAGISHDLRTPLARLRLETEMSVNDEEAKRNMAPTSTSSTPSSTSSWTTRARARPAAAGAGGAADRPRGGAFRDPSADPHHLARGDRPGRCWPTRPSWAASS